MSVRLVPNTAAILQCRMFDWKLRLECPVPLSLRTHHVYVHVFFILKWSCWIIFARKSSNSRAYFAEIPSCSWKSLEIYVSCVLITLAFDIRHPAWRERNKWGFPSGLNFFRGSGGLGFFHRSVFECLYFFDFIGFYRFLFRTSFSPRPGFSFDGTTTRLSKNKTPGFYMDSQWTS